MAIHDYRYDPFNNTFTIRAIRGEKHTIPKNSPFTVRLYEVPQRTEPTSLSVKFKGGAALTEVAALPGQGQYWPDYRTTEHGISDWNTGTLLFNAADAGKEVEVTYNGMGTLTDDRLLDQADIAVTTSTQPERDATGITASLYTEGPKPTPPRYQSIYGVDHLKTHTGIKAGTYTLRAILQQLVNLSHTQEYYREWKQCNCDCDCDCGDDTGGGGP